MSIENELSTSADVSSREFDARGTERRLTDRRSGSAAHPLEASGYGAAIMVSIGLLVTAAIHVIDLPGREPTYSGYLYLGLIAAAIGLAIINAVRPSVMSLAAAAALCVAVIIGFVLTRTIGLPNWTDDIGVWDEALGIAALTTESFTVVFAAIAIYAKK